MTTLVMKAVEILHSGELGNVTVNEEINFIPCELQYTFCLITTID